MTRFAARRWIALQNATKEKTRIHHQHLRLGEELPGLHHKVMKYLGFGKSFFEESFSAARMRPYFDRYPGNETKAIRHYEQNIRLAESLSPPLSVFEVTLRNSIIRELERMTGTKEWYIYFKWHPNLKSLYKYVITANNHILARGEIVTADKINGELTMGFWVSLFNAEYERFLWKDLRRAFPRLPKQKRQRKNVSAPLNVIRTLRNRVFHNESISWNLDRLTDLHDIIVEVIGWMNPNLPLWMRRVDRYHIVSTVVKRQWYGWLHIKLVHCRRRY